MLFQHEKHTIKMLLEYGLPEDEHRMLETSRRQEELN